MTVIFVVGGAPLFARSLPPAGLPGVEALITSDQFLVNGEVSARTDTDLTVLKPTTAQATTIQVSDETIITRGAVTIHLRDLKVGDKVTVTAAREANGLLVAAKITVRLPDES